MDVKQILAFNKLIKTYGKYVSDKWDYNFKAVNISDFELKLKYKAKSKVLKSVFRQTAKTLSRLNTKFAKLAVSDPDKITKFEVPEEFLNRVKTAINKNLSSVYKEVRQDGIIVVRDTVKSCVFSEDSNDNNILNIIVKVGGQYAQE